MKPLIVLFLLVLSINANSQTPIIPENVDTYSKGFFGPSRIIVKLDPFTRIPLSDIPADRNFYIRVYFNEKDPLPGKVYLINKGKSGSELLTIVLNKNIAAKDDDYLKIYNAVDILMPPLKPNHDFEFAFIYPSGEDLFQTYFNIFYSMYTKSNTGELYLGSIAGNSGWTELKDLKTFYEENNLEKIFDNKKLVKEQISTLFYTKNYIKVDANTTKTIFLNARLSGNFNTTPYKVENSAALSLIADAGIIYAGFRKGFSIPTPYVGLCLSFRPYDTDIKFRQVRKLGLSTWERLSFQMGLTLSTLAKDHLRADLFEKSNLMTGFGYRISNIINITAGGVFYHNLKGANNLKSIGFVPHIGLSINLKIKEALGDLAKVFTYSK